MYRPPNPPLKNYPGPSPPRRTPAYGQPGWGADQGANQGTNRHPDGLQPRATPLAGPPHRDARQQGVPLRQDRHEANSVPRRRTDDQRAQQYNLQPGPLNRDPVAWRERSRALLDSIVKEPPYGANVPAPLNDEPPRYNPGTPQTPHATHGTAGIAPNWPVGYPGGRAAPGTQRDPNARPPDAQPRRNHPNPGGRTAAT